MRLSNYKNIAANKASISITATLYDRRALDCTTDKPLVNSLNNLTFLASSSAKVRETLVVDGGLLRLVDILTECFLDSEEAEEAEEAVNAEDAELDVDNEEAQFSKTYSGFQTVLFNYLNDLLKEVGHLGLDCTTSLSSVDVSESSTISEEHSLRQIHGNCSSSKLGAISKSVSRKFDLFMDYLSDYKAKKRFRDEKRLNERKILVSWKWTLTLQVLVLCGTRGNEKIRKKIVKSGIIQIVATVLDNYLLVKSGKVKLDTETSEPSRGRSSVISSSANTAIVADPSTDPVETAQDHLQSLFNEVINSIYSIVSNLNGAANNTPQQVSISEVREQVQRFIQSTITQTETRNMFVPPQQLHSLATLLLETLQLLSKASVSQASLLNNGNESNLQLLESIKANIRMIMVLLRGLTENMHHINENLGHLQNITDRDNPLSLDEVNDLISITNALNSRVGTSNALNSYQMNNLMNDQLTNDQSTDDQSINNQSTNNQSINNQSTNNQSTNDQSINNQSTNNQSINNQSTNNQSTNDQSTNNQSTNNQLPNNQSDSTNNPPTSRNIINGSVMNENISTMAQEISNGLFHFGQMVANGRDANSNHSNETLALFNKALSEIMFQNNSNENNPFIKLHETHHVSDNKHLYWGVSTATDEIILSLDEEGNLNVVCNTHSSRRDSIVMDLIVVCEMFGKNVSNANGVVGLERYNGKFSIIQGADQPATETVQDSPYYYGILAHLFKNVFFRDMEGAFHTNFGLAENWTENVVNDASISNVDIDPTRNPSNNTDTATNEAPANETAANETAANETAANETAANETAAAETNQYFDSVLFSPPREFYKGKIVPTDDDIIWVLQLLAFVSKYSYMKDVLQFSYILPKLSLREYPNDDVGIKYGSHELSKCFHSEFGKKVDIDSLSKKIVENHFKRGWEKIGNEFYMFNKKMGSNIRDLPFFFQNDAVLFGYPSPSIDVYLMSRNMLAIMNNIGDQPALCSKEDEACISHTEENIEDRLFSLKINCYMEQFNENIKLLEKTNREDIAELFYLISKYKEMISIVGTALKDDNSTDESSGDEVESVNSSSCRIMQPLEGPMEIKGLSRREVERLNIKYLDSGAFENIVPEMTEDSNREEMGNRIKTDEEANDVNSRAVNFNIDKSILIYEINKKFEKILKVNSKLTSKLKKIKQHEKRKSLIQKKWNYDEYDFDDYDYQSLTSMSEKPSPQVQEGSYQKLRQNYIHLPLNYCKAPIIASLVENYHKDLPTIDSLNFYPANQREKEIFKFGKSTIISKHDLDYSSIPLDYLNVFGLVEKFSVDTYPSDINHWAGVIMRNSCRKDEQKGGIRQCANTKCGKWETDRKFSKCRRCRRAKYCSKECQYEAWEFHKYWCQPASSSSSSGTGSTSGSRHHHHHHRSSRHRTDQNDTQSQAEGSSTQLGDSAVERNDINNGQSADQEDNDINNGQSADQEYNNIPSVADT